MGGWGTSGGSHATQPARAGAHGGRSGARRYLGRPCYTASRAPGCGEDLWTRGRYSEPLVASRPPRPPVLAARAHRDPVVRLQRWGRPGMLPPPGGGTRALVTVAATSTPSSGRACAATSRSPVAQPRDGPGAAGARSPAALRGRQGRIVRPRWSPPDPSHRDARRGPRLRPPCCWAALWPRSSATRRAGRRRCGRPRAYRAKQSNPSGPGRIEEVARPRGAAYLIGAYSAPVRWPTAAPTRAPAAGAAEQVAARRVPGRQQHVHEDLGEGRMRTARAVGHGLDPS